MGTHSSASQVKSRKEPKHLVLAARSVYPIFTACLPETDAIKKKMQMLKLDEEATTTVLSRPRPARSRLRTEARSWVRAAGLGEEVKGDGGEEENYPESVKSAQEQTEKKATEEEADVTSLKDRSAPRGGVSRTAPDYSPAKARDWEGS